MYVATRRLFVGRLFILAMKELCTIMQYLHFWTLTVNDDHHAHILTMNDQKFHQQKNYRENLNF